ncbi:hypothetical protein [Geodermatophilus sp. SYSU D01176]
MIQFLSFRADQHKWPYNDYLREADLAVAAPELVATEDAAAEIRGDRAPDGYTVWVAGQDRAGDWYPMSQAFWDDGLNAYTAIIGAGQVPNPEFMRLHPVVANASGQAGLEEYRQRGDKTVGLDKLPDGAVPADQ